MKQWLQKMLYGRYGADQLGTFLMIIFVCLAILNLWLGWPHMWVIYALLLVCCYYRILSRNIYKRRAENQAFMKLYAPVRNWFKDKQERFRDRKTHKYFKCPKCSQRLRVPKGKGDIVITCAKCHNRFDAHT